MENLDFMSEFERIQQLHHFRVAIGIIFDIKGWRTLRNPETEHENCLFPNRAAY